MLSVCVLCQLKLGIIIVNMVSSCDTEIREVILLIDLIVLVFN
jgi:hypothetical protein